MKRVFFANSLKGTLSNSEIFFLYKNIFPSKNDIVIPVSDGGDGFLNLIKFIHPSGKKKFFKTFSPDGEKMDVETFEFKNTLFIESAKIVGFLNVKDIYKNPEKRSSKGIGFILKKVYNDYKKIYLGIGGTTTFDLGAGSFELLGYETLKLPESEILIDFKKNENSIILKNLISVCDVSSPLDGRSGALTFLKQKGVKEKDLKFYESIFKYVAKKYGVSGKDFLGSGGGLGFFTHSVGGKNISCWEFLSKNIKIENLIKESDSVVINEGKFDDQSMMGKINGEIVKRSLKYGKKVFVITGEVDLKSKKLKKVLTFIILDKKSKDCKIEFFKKAKILKEIIDG
ncbi:MAG: glycerate kinase [bacterium]|uniref:Glycerate kinase n=2 Tax=Bacteria candidate phyla TaxID=1783234 RepID=A0A101I3I8_UNCT6|nr:MAG: Glycerate kinase [candidate division TA06 bacterium 32_111]KUK87829.1 MAG: Glycerate kinase [candidate division TA06 bacterium 34_109]MDI6700640.1 glycerate kinase [bacterium]HAF07982.1 hypothetical protein [candidate division WOR-3 bacterium]HCP16316.1 hypothetical protein [candidate division WOR-3 bacterium]